MSDQTVYEYAALVAEAHAVGVVSSRERREGQVRIRLASRPRSGTGRAVQAVLVGGRAVAYVKERTDRPTATAGSPTERSALAQLAGLELAPRVLADAAALWTSALPGTALDLLRGTAADLAEVAQSWGLALAGLHTEHGARPRAAAPRPWVLGAAAPRWPQRKVPPDAAALVLRVAASDPALRRAARQAHDRWTESGWIHGDIAPRHVIATCAGSGVRFVDFAAAGAGDPRWDVACALESIAQLAPVWRVSENVLSEYFLLGYRRGGGPGRVDPELRGLRALDIAWQIAAGEQAAGGPGSVRDEVGAWLTRARAFVGRSGQLSWAA
jgi:aminoglycoside phosphotransferase